MSARHARECRWCGDRFKVEFPHSPALYCKRTHKTAAEKARKQLRDAGIQPCPQPWSPAEPYRGLAIAAARQLGTRADECACGNYHVRTPEQGRNSMRIEQLIDPGLLASMISQGYIRERRHPTLPYRILGYSESTQYERVWNQATLQCRGLVVHDAGTVIARPFGKFFGDGEHDGERLPALDFTAPVEVTDKLDGSLAISVPTPDGLIIATRGSFESDQARWATDFYRTHYADTFVPDPAYTYLWEILYKANRIVVDYDFEDLVLLGAVHIDSGRIVAAADIDWPGRKATQFEYRTLADALAAPVRDNAEGFVVRYLDTDLMVKIKFERYVALHRIVTGLSEKVVWEHAAAEKPFEELLIDLPDEFHRWVTDVWDDLQSSYDSIEATARNEFARIRRALPIDSGRKEFALKATELDPRMRPLLFVLLDGNMTKLHAAIWRSLKPAGDTRMLNAEEAA